MPPGGGFIAPFAGWVIPHLGVVLPPHLVIGGGFITRLGWFYPPVLVILSPYWPGGGVGPSQCEPRNSVPEDRQTHSALFRLLWFRLFCFALLCCVIFCFGGIEPPWGGFITHKGWLYPPKGVVFIPQRGGFIPHKSGHKTTRGGFKGGVIPHLGVVLCPGPPGNYRLPVSLGQSVAKYPLLHTHSQGECRSCSAHVVGAY